MTTETETKTCSKCSVEKPLNEFRKCRRHRDGRRSTCKDCHAQREFERQLPYNPEVAKRKREANLKRNYGIDSSKYAEMLSSQNGKCKICGSPDPGGKGRFHVDHCHSTGAIRGLLCHHCNLGLGNFKDDPTLLTSAANYLLQQNDY